MYKNFVNSLPFQDFCYLFKHFIAVVSYLKILKSNTVCLKNVRSTN